MIEFAAIAGKTIRDLIAREWWRSSPFPMRLDGDEEHLQVTMQWLARAAEHGGGGVSSHYSLLAGRWLPPFPETTGYIIPTCFDYADRTGDESFRNLAVALADWLGSIQLDSGACMAGQYVQGKPARPIIFNTGQNIFGFLRAYRETGETRHLDRAVAAGDFLAGSVDGHGIWDRALHFDIPHTYNSRTCWALLELHEATGNDRYRDIAVANLDWVVDQQQENGWFRNAAFKPGELPNTHGLAYTARGLVESYTLCADPRYLASARLLADRFARIFEIRKFPYTFWDERFRNHGKYFHRLQGRYVCVTGGVQFALVWMRLYELTGDATYLSTAFKLIDFTKRLQDIRTRHDGVRGGIPGAFPIHGSYSTLKYPSWAAKFFADALMMKIRLMSDERVLRPDAALAAR